MFINEQDEKFRKVMLAVFSLVVLKEKTKQKNKKDKRKKSNESQYNIMLSKSPDSRVERIFSDSFRKTQHYLLKNKS